MNSPFSLQQDWNLFWKRLPSNTKPLEFIQCESVNEQRALHAIAKIGVIGGRQLLHLFSLDRKRLKKMEREQKIVRHELTRGNQITPIYTLGLTGAIITKHSGYEINHWVEYDTESVLKRLLFFNFYKFFHGADIIPTPEPFVGAVNFRNNPLYIYVVRGDTNDLLNYLKWKKHTFNGRLIIIAESIRHVQPFVMHTQDLKMRITTDNDLIQANHLRNLFYFMNKDGEIMKEAQ